MVTTNSAVLSWSPVLAVNGSYPPLPLMGVDRDTKEALPAVLVFSTPTSCGATRLRHDLVTVPLPYFAAIDNQKTLLCPPCYR